MLAVVIVGFSPSIRAAATLRISIDNRVTWTNVVDNGPLDLDTNVGIVTFTVHDSSAPFRGVFAGTSQRVEGFPTYMDLNCSVEGSPNPLVVQFSDDGFDPFVGIFQTSIGGIATKPLTWKTLVDPANHLFVGTNLASAAVATEEFVANSNSPIYSLSSYALTSEVAIGASANGSSFDLFLQPYSPTPPVLYPTVSSGSVSLSFESESDFTYTLEYKNSLTDADWTPQQSVQGNDRYRPLWWILPRTGKRDFIV